MTHFHQTLIRVAFLAAAAMGLALFLMSAPWWRSVPEACAARYEVPTDAQHSGTREECTWFIRSATDPTNPGQLVVFPTNGESGMIGWKAQPPWVFIAEKIQSAYIAPGVIGGPDLYGFFNGAKNMTYADVSNFDVSGCTVFWSFFNECRKLERIDGIEDWDMAQATNLRNMFKRCYVLPSLDLSRWEIGKNPAGAIDMESVFEECNALQSVGDLSGWDTSACTTMDSLFWRCTSLKEVQSISGWDTSNVTSFHTTFSETGLTSLDISSWDTTAALDLHKMFTDMNGGIVEYITLGPKFTFEPEGLQEGVWKPETRTSFPAFTGEDGTGFAYTGRWIADSNGAVYEADAIPSLTADTYRPERVRVKPAVLEGIVSVVGNYTFDHALLSVSEKDVPLDAELAYAWYTGSKKGSLETLVSMEDTYTPSAQDVGKFITCVVTDASGSYEGELVAQGACVTAELVLSVPDTAYGTVSADGSISWESMGNARNLGSCAVLISKASSTVIGQESASCNLEGTVISENGTAPISWEGIQKAGLSVYEKLALNPGATLNMGAFVYEFEPTRISMPK